MNKKHIFLIIALLIFASLATFGRIAGNDFITHDDIGYITGNGYVQSGLKAENIKPLLTITVMGNWHPLTLVSHTLDWSIFRDNAGGHHLVSLLFHIGAAVLLFLFLYQSTNNFWPAAFAAFFFTLHPLRVESVAWASERKDVLSMFWGMAALYAYLPYTSSRQVSRYIVCLFLFALALLSKPMMVTLPLVMLLLDYWPLKRWQKALSSPKEIRLKLTGRIVWEKIPFFILSFTVGIITVWAQCKAGALVHFEGMPLAGRISNAATAYVVYLGKIFWPYHLSIFYPYDSANFLWETLIAAFIMTAITFLVVCCIKKLSFLFVGWFWYLITLIPVIGIIQVGEQSMADRYTYLPTVGIAIMLAWGFTFLYQTGKIGKNVLSAGAVITILTMAVLSWHQCGYWKNSFTLFNHALRVTKNNYVAYNNRGIFYAKIGLYQQAISDYNESIRLKPDYIEAYNNLGAAYASLNKHQDAIKNYNEALRLNPDHAEAYNNRGLAYGKLGQYQQAIADFNEAIHLKPDYADAYHNRAYAHLLQGNNVHGCMDAQKACEWGMCRLLMFAESKGLCLETESLN